MGRRMESRFNPTKEELERLYQFYSCTQIGRQYGVCAEIVRRALHKHGIGIRKVGGRRRFDPPKEVLESLYQEMSMAEIAKHFDVGETVVFKRIKEHGIELKEHKNHRLKPGRQFSEEHIANIRKARKENAKYGADNPNWKGGLTDEHRKLRGSWRYREWKERSLERAGYKCEICGAVNGYMCECCGTKIRLHVHHVKSFAKYPDLRFDPQNSEVLCPKCHNSKHRMKTG